MSPVLAHALNFNLYLLTSWRISRQNEQRSLTRRSLWKGYFRDILCVCVGITHFHMTGFARSLVFTWRQKEARKWLGRMVLTCRCAHHASTVVPAALPVSVTVTVFWTLRLSAFGISVIWQHIGHAPKIQPRVFYFKVVLRFNTQTSPR